MSTSERYYTCHLRSLFISKFNYRYSSQIVQCTELRFLMQTPFGSYALAGIFSFLVSNFWPRTRLLRKTFKGRDVAPDVLFHVKVSNQENVFDILTRFSYLYFPELESWSGLDRLFTGSRVSGFNVSFDLKSIFYIFFELDFLVNYAFTFLKVATASWMLRLVFLFNTTSGLEQSTFLRAVSFPALRLK